MKIKFINARILSLKSDFKIIEGDLVTDNDRISYIGKTIDNDQNKYDRIIDLKGNVIMPGFKNAHTHSAMTFLRSYADDLPLKEWLYDAIFPMEAKLTKDDIYHLSKVAFAEYLTTGATACFDMYYHLDAVAQSSIDFGFRTVCLGTVNDYKESVNLLKEHYQTINKMHPLVSHRLGFHAEYTTSEPILIELSKLANELKTPIFTHISETSLEVQGCIDRHGLTPPLYFEKLGLFNYGGGGFHCVYLSDEDIELFKRRGLYLISCPGSNTKIASGIAPIQKYIDHGLNIGLGTDGPASNNCLDMFKEMMLTFSLGKVDTHDPIAIDPYRLLKMATVEGAHAMGLFDSDVLDVGKYADLTVIDLCTPNMQPINNIVKNIVYSGAKSNIKLTMINGKILYEDGKFFLKEPIEQIYLKAQEITERIKKEK
jgi:5-methylthioadenosine/S-adenosylhomocysteine deaminase